VRPGLRHVTGSAKQSSLVSEKSDCCIRKEKGRGTENKVNAARGEVGGVIHDPGKKMVLVYVGSNDYLAALAAQETSEKKKFTCKKGKL